MRPAEPVTGTAISQGSQEKASRFLLGRTQTGLYWETTRNNKGDTVKVLDPQDEILPAARLVTISLPGWRTADNGGQLVRRERIPAAVVGAGFEFPRAVCFE